MASQEINSSTTATANVDIQQPQPHRTEEQAAESTPVEMSNLKQEKTTEKEKEEESATAGAEEAPDTTSQPAAPSQLQDAQPSGSTSAPPLQRLETEALGPATENPNPQPAHQTGPTLLITLMLTTGVRHPYKLDEKYLRSRKVESTSTDGSFDPRDLSGYKLKELIWTDWRSEWETRPSSPSLIRLIIMGRMVEDKSTLKEFPFTLASSDGPQAQPNVLHMTVKPADLVDDDAEGGGKHSGKGGNLRAREGGDADAGCCKCVVQ